MYLNFIRDNDGSIVADNLESKKVCQTLFGSTVWDGSIQIFDMFQVVGFNFTIRNEGVPSYRAKVCKTFDQFLGNSPSLQTVYP